MVYWPDQEPLRQDGPLKERLNSWMTLVHRGQVIDAYRTFLGLMEDKPSRMFEILRDCGALARVLPEVDRLWGVPQRADYHPEVDTGVHNMMVLDMSARLAAPLMARLAEAVRGITAGGHKSGDSPMSKP